MSTKTEDNSERIKNAVNLIRCACASMNTPQTSYSSQNLNIEGSDGVLRTVAYQHTYQLRYNDPESEELVTVMVVATQPR